MSARSHQVIVPIVALLFLGACGTEGTGGSTTTEQPALSTTVAPPSTTTTLPPTTTTTEPATTTTTVAPAPVGHVVYFLLEELEAESGGPFLVPVYRESMVGPSGSLVMESLLAGPTPDESSGVPSMSTAVPEGTELLGVEIEAGTATVDLSSDFDDGGGSFSVFARIAQVTYTLTRLPDVERVTFMLDGEPVTVFSGEGIEINGPQTRNDYQEFLPFVFVDYPTWGQPVTSPITARGVSNAFEAVSQIALTDGEGLILFEDMVMASCGSGCWGEWEVKIPYEIDRNQLGALIVWEDSAKDGSRVHVREYPVLLRG
jgi:germination protein M